MTCNQTMVLLDIYRGTFMRPRHMGTVADDIRLLAGKGYIAVTGGHATREFRVTDAGFKKVKKWLERLD